MIKAFVAVFLLVAATNCALAEDATPNQGADAANPPLPVYDVEYNCHIRRGGSKKDVETCIFIEQQGYNEIKSIWDGLLPVTKLRAIHFVETIPAAKIWSYHYLNDVAIHSAVQDMQDATRESAKQGFKP